MNKRRFSFNRLSIRKSTLVLAVIPAVLIFVLLTPYNLYERTNDMQHALQKQGSVLADQLAQISEYGLITGNVDYLQDTVTELLLDPEIYSIEILDNKKGEITIGIPSDDTFNNAKAEGNIKGTYGQSTPIRGKKRDFMGIKRSDLNNIKSEYPIKTKEERQKTQKRALELVALADISTDLIGDIDLG